MSPDGNLAHDVYMTIRDRILHWQYPPDHRLTEAAICQEFHISRSPVREALRMLAENDLVDKIPHQGYRVTQPDIARIRDYYDTRIALEQYVIELLARDGMPPEDWAYLHGVWSTVGSRMPLAVDELSAVDEEFHERLARSIGNDYLLHLLKDIGERIRFVRLADYASPERQAETCSQHLGVLEAIASRDPQRAREAIRQHIENGRSNVMAAIREALANAYTRRRPD